MLDLTIIILTYNEEKHIRRLLDNVTPIAKEIYIIDSFSTDRTIEIAREYPNVRILQHKWENNHAKQFNWGLMEANPKTEWIMRLDADEYLEIDLIKRLQKELPYLPNEISSINLCLRHKFMEKFLRGGTGSVYLTRIFRNGKAQSEERLMDEHIKILEGKTITWKEHFVDDNLNDLSWWTAKHNGYATREAAALLDEEYGLSDMQLTEDSKTNKKKSFYLRLPLFWRAFAYFIYRYFVRGGFLEGKEGFIWCFLQGWWYRTLVDAKIFEIKKKCGKNPKKIKEYLKSQYGIIL